VVKEVEPDDEPPARPAPRPRVVRRAPQPARQQYGQPQFDQFSGQQQQYSSQQYTPYSSQQYAPRPQSAPRQPARRQPQGDPFAQSPAGTRWQ
jgi:hypothetical protein